MRNFPFPGSRRVRRRKPLKAPKPPSSLPRRLRLMKPLPCCCPHHSAKDCGGTAALWSAMPGHRFWPAAGRRQTTRTLRLPRAAERGSAWPARRPSGQSGDKSPHSKSRAGCVSPKPGRTDLRAPRPPFNRYMFWGNALSVRIRVHPWLNSRFSSDDSAPIILPKVAGERRRRRRRNGGALPSRRSRATTRKAKRRKR